MADDKFSIEETHRVLSQIPNYFVSGGNETLALANGSPVSPERTTQPSAAGIQQGFIIRVEAKVKNNHATESAEITDFGMCNLLQRIEYTDTGGYSRHAGLTGIGLELASYARNASVLGAASMNNANYGVNLGAGGSDTAPAEIAAGQTVRVSHTFFLPFAFSPYNQTGAIATLFTQGQQTLKLTFPTKSAAFVADTANKMRALYAKGDCGFVDLRYEVINVTKNRGVPTPQLNPGAFANVYHIQEGFVTALAENNDKKVALDNGRTHYNAFLIYDNGGVLNRETDVNSLSVMYGGTEDTKRANPYIHGMIANQIIKSGLPPATYYLSFADDPLNTAAKGGSIDLIFNPSTVNSGATLYTLIDYIQAGNAVSM